MAADDAINIAPNLTLPAGVIRFSYSRSSGPGGQNVNKLNTRAALEVHLADLEEHLRHPVVNRLARLAGPGLLTADGRLLITCDTNRSQRANRDECLERLRQLILRARVVPKRRKKTRPSRSSVEKRLQHKKQRGQIKRRRREGFD
ncbi:MAG: alternative ribosome rescue aminoacyl-tRNA hydrolase ArfB [Phycisphaeraceae bacterium]